MGTTAKGLWYPNGSDSPSPFPPVLAAMQASVGDNPRLDTPAGIHVIDDAPARATLVSRLTDVGYTPSANTPIYAFQSDTKTLMIFDGTTWKATVERPTATLDTRDLNGVVVPETYFQTAIANATTGRHYPVEFSGMLRVSALSGRTYQEYVVDGDPLAGANASAFFVRFSSDLGSSWSAWFRVSNFEEPAPEPDPDPEPEPDPDPDPGTTSGTGWVRFADGTQMCWGTVTITPVANSVTSTTWTYPKTFHAAPVISIAPETNSVAVKTVMVTTAPTTSSCKPGVVRSNKTSTKLHVTATGRWKA